LDVEPLKGKHVFRDENRSKDINNRMYFGPKDALDRIRDAAMYPNFLEQHPSPQTKRSIVMNTVQEEKLTDSSRLSLSTKRTVSSICPKDIFPSLHRKTHFNAVISSLTLNGRKSNVRRSPSPLPAIKDIKDTILKQGTFTMDEAASVAIEVLESCNVKTKLNSSYLRCGAGKLVGNPDTTVGEVYSRLGSKTQSTTPSFLKSGIVI
jgi:hypothetical protein